MKYYIYDTTAKKRVNGEYNTALETFEAIIRLVNQEEIDELNGKTDESGDTPSPTPSTGRNESFDWTLTGNPNGIYIPTYKIIPSVEPPLPGTEPYAINYNSEDVVNTVPEPIIDESSNDSNNSSSILNTSSNEDTSGDDTSKDKYTLDDATYAKFAILDTKSYVDEEIDLSTKVFMMRQITSLTTALLADLSAKLEIDDIKIVSPTGEIGDMFAVNQNDCVETLNLWLLDKCIHYQIIVDAESIEEDIIHYYKENPYEIINVVTALNWNSLYDNAWKDAKQVPYTEHTALDESFNAEDSYRRFIISDLLPSEVLYSATKYDVLVEYFNDIDNILTLLKDNYSDKGISVNLAVKKLLDKWVEAESDFKEETPEENSSGPEESNENSNETNNENGPQRTLLRSSKLVMNNIPQENFYTNISENEPQVEIFSAKDPIEQ